MIKAMVLVFMVCCLHLVQANLNVYAFDDEAKAQRFEQLIHKLRCPKCQNNNLADSNAPLASDIKRYIYDAVKSEKSNQTIVNFLVSRYGEFITYRPRNRWIWILPTLISVVAVIFVLVNIGRQRRRAQFSPVPSMDDIIRDHERDNGHG